MLSNKTLNRRTLDSQSPVLWKNRKTLNPARLIREDKQGKLYLGLVMEIDDRRTRLNEPEKEQTAR